MFPPDIVKTSRRPDITSYSASEKQGTIIELPVPAEENLAQATSTKNKTEQNKTKRNKTKQNKTKQNKTKQNKTKHQQQQQNN